MSQMKRACGFVIFRRIRGAIEYLLMQTSYGEHHWTPPKGHVDPGESDMQTALRETREEAGFVEDDLKIYEDAKQELNYNVSGSSKIVIYWLAELINANKPVKLSEEHQAFSWLPLEEACSLAKYTEMQDALNEFNKYILKNVLVLIDGPFWNATAPDTIIIGYVSADKENDTLKYVGRGIFIIKGRRATVVMANFIQKILSFLEYWYFRYTLVTELYMVEKWERYFINIFLVTMFFLLFVVNYKILLPATERFLPY